MSKVITRRPNGTTEVKLVNDEPSMTDQSQARDCDINVIVNRFMKQGIVPPLHNKKGVYGDFTNAPSYQDAFDFINEANQKFMALPSQLRSKFHNDPHELIEYLNDKDKVEDSYKLGLRVRPAPVPVDQNLEEMKSMHETIKKQGTVKKKEEG